MTYPLNTRVHRDLDVDTIARVYTFAQPALSAGQLPEFGSEAWAALPIDSPDKLYAIIRAAMAWWTGMAFGAEIAEDLIHRELNTRLAQASKAIQAADPDLWRRVARDRAAGVPQQRDRSRYPAPVGGV